MPPRRDGAPTPTSSPPPSPGGTPSASKGATPPPSSPHPASKGPSAPGGTGTDDEAAATPPSSPRCGGSPPVASRSPASFSFPASPRVHCGGRGSPPTASPSPTPASSPGVGVSLVELVATGDGKPAAGAHEEEGEVEKAMEDPVKTTARSDPEKQLSSAPGGTGTGDATAATPPSSLRCCGIPSAASTPPASASRPTSPRVHCGGSTPMTISSDAVSESGKQSLHEVDLDPTDRKPSQHKLAEEAEEVEQRENVATQRGKQLEERETLLRQTHYAVPQGHAGVSNWVEKEEEEEKRKRKGKEKEDEGEENEQEQGKGEHNHSCPGSGLFPWTAELPRDDALAALKQQLLMPQQSKLMPTPSDTPNAATAEITAMTMRTSTPKAKVYQFETRFMAPSLDQSTSEINDLEMVKVGLLVLTRLSENLHERRLYSTIHEVLKAAVATYNTNQLMTERDRVRWEIRKILTDQTQNLGIAIDDVSIVSLSFEKVFTQDIQEKEVTTQEDRQGNRTTQEAGQDNRSAMIRSQDDDQIWNKRQIGYIFDLGTALGIIFLIRPWLPSSYDRWIMAAFAAVWGAGSVGLPIGMFGTSRVEKNCSRHVGRFISLSFSLLVIYAIYILTLNVAGTPPTPSVSSFGITNGDGDGDADWWTTAGFIVIAALVSFGHLWSWIRGCCTGGDRDMLP
ncbi:nucleolar protein dao-5-like [Triticum dicoccoides]|uniref:nucleolar protein dao-5-like n=1 Tax=Triticum dicoccoides TaxID=85692 RepID=UPI00188DEF13|nr:nucleolar protein dao-5-like [Triticum dicoccoides]